MPENNTSNDSTLYFARCLGIYHLIARPTGDTFTTYTLVIIILSILSILSAFGNGLILYVYLKQKSLQCTNTLLLMCLAFLDFVSAALLEPLYVVRLFSEIFGFTSCVFILIVRRLLEYLRPVSFMTLALITIERYLALFKAITHRRMVTKQRILYVVSLIWFSWFVVICIRSFLPKITSVFYIFFTFVAFSLLMGNFVMNFKIGKLAHLHNRPTRVSNAPGSLSVRYENPTSLSPGSTNPGVTYSQTRAANAKDILNGKRRSSAKIGIQPTESVVKTIRTDVHPHKKAAIESDVLSTVGETSTKLSHDVDTNNLQSNLKVSTPQALDNTATIKLAGSIATSRFGSNDKAEINNCAKDDENSTSETPKVKDRDITKVFENKENEKNPARTSSTHINTQPINTTSVCTLECSDDRRGYVRTDQVSNGTSPRQFQSTHFTIENASKTSQFTNKEKLETKTDLKNSTMPGPNDKSLLQAHDTPDSSENTTNTNSIKSFENAKQVRDTIKVEIDTKVEKTAQTTQLDEEKRQVKCSDGSPTNFVLQSTEKTNKTAHQTTSRASIKNEKFETRERNATWTVFYIVAILTLCYMPISVLLVYLSFQKEPDANTLFIYLPIADTIALFNALVNPFIYCLKNRKMRAAVKSVLHRTRNSS